MKYVDPDGREIKIDDSSGQDFVDDVKVALEYLKQSESGKKIISELENSTIVFYIKKCNWINSYDEDRFDGDNNIFWSSKHSVEATNGDFNSPAVCLMHELIHAWETKTSNGQRNFYVFSKNNESRLGSLSLLQRREEFATAIERLVVNELGEPNARRVYNDLKRDQGYSYTITLPEHSPLTHSKSRRK